MRVYDQKLLHKLIRSAMEAGEMLPLRPELINEIGIKDDELIKENHECWFDGKTKKIWTEDDAGTPDRETLDAAWKRLVKEPGEQIAYYDEGDSMWTFYTSGYIKIVSYDGGHIEFSQRIKNLYDI